MPEISSERFDFAPTRSAGLARLAAFAPRSGLQYRAARNYDFGPEWRSNISGLSPYTRVRLVTEQEIAAAALAAHGLEKAEKFIQEVCWRTYWKGWLERRPYVWRDYLDAAALHQADLTPGSALLQRYDKAAAGKTGIDCFDAWAGELRETGYLHNHARMWMASIWVHTLGLPWELGAGWFLQHLLDGDPASNTLSWRWVAGLHTEGKSYLARADNIAKFTDGRFNPAGQLAMEAPTVEAAPVTAPALPAPRPQALRHGEAALIITEEDLHPESLDLGALTITAIAAIDPSALYPGHSPLMRAFRSAAAADALDRARAHFGCGGEMFAAGDDVGMAHWTSQQGAATAVTAYMPQGRQRRMFPAAEAALQVEGVAVIQILRPWDAAFWPHADRGFFKLKKKIPKALAQCGQL